MFNSKEYMDDLIASGEDREVALILTKEEAKRRKAIRAKGNIEQAKRRETKPVYTYLCGPRIPRY